jgi:2-polyprenyl-3-methyl-5-hydroxy-6-metoxy-1,4-benzoquinol methylase
MNNWQCPVCAGTDAEARWRVTSTATENGVNPSAFRPSADRYGETVAAVVRCRRCGHGSLAETPTERALAAAYADAADPVSLDEEAGQLETAGRGLRWIETVVSPGPLLDLGCWTGSFVAAAAVRGWSATGIEPSTWAVDRARDRGRNVNVGDLTNPGVEKGSQRCVVMCDVIEHLLDVAAAITIAADLLEPGGALYLTTPDAGSRVAKVMGARWWSVLPMHVQYFSRESIRRLLTGAGLQLVGMSSHPKVFTAAYYADRLGGYSPRLAQATTAVSRRIGLADRLVAPDFHDRMQVLAVKAR